MIAAWSVHHLAARSARGFTLLQRHPIGPLLGPKHVYDDNVLLTCAPVEHAVSGQFSLKKWDKLSPAGKHHAAHIYDGMLKTGYQPQSADDYASWITRHGAVPGLITPLEWDGMVANDDRPSVGHWSQRTALALDLAALAIVNLNSRLKALETKP